jgi:hypothetical protein
MADGSLAYRKAKADIWAGKVPAKYTRLLPYITGSPVLEIGSAEGVLALLLTRRGAKVTGLELREERHREALRLREHWRMSGVPHCRFFVGDIRDHLHLLNNVQTLVAVRTIYYLRADAPGVLACAASTGVRRVVLCGNRNRAAQSEREPTTELGQFNRLASLDGMRELLTGAGYSIDTVVAKGDPIVVGFLL